MPRAEQFRGVPDYPTEPLLPVSGGEWSIGEDGVVEGVRYQGKKPVAYAPIPVTRMKMKAYIVGVDFEADGADVCFSFTLRYRARNGKPRGEPGCLISRPLECADGKSGRFGFVIPQEHLYPQGMFSCTLAAHPAGHCLCGKCDLDTPDPTCTPLIVNVWQQVAAPD